MQKTQQRDRGFTLLELIIVIAILAILSVAVILVINPAETLRRSRDATRLSDLSAVKSALAFYLTECCVSGQSIDLSGAGTCANDGAGGGAETAWVSTTATDADDVVCGDTAPNESTSGAVDGNGWIPVNLNNIPNPPGGPLSNFPLDPTNAIAGQGAGDSTIGTDNGDLFYAYGCNDTNLQFELLANLESSTYRAGGSLDKEGTDGGDDANVYEVGNALGLCVNY